MIDLVSAARAHLGVKFAHQGRDPAFGLDCAGLAVRSARDCGLDVVDCAEYKRSPEVSLFLEFLHKNCDLVAPADLRPGDLMIFATMGGGPQHLAIYTQDEPPSMIHSYAPAGRVVEHIMDATWLRLRRQIFRFREQ